MPILKHLTTIQAIAKATDQTLSTLRWLATQFRAAHLFSHKAHINVGGDAFIANHEWLGEIYPQFDGYWDALTERIKGLGGAAMIDKVNSDAAKMSEALGEGDNDFYFRTILQMVSQAVGVIDEAAKETTMDEGVRDLIVGISSELQVLQYKIGQRLGGVEKSITTIAKDKDAGGHGSNPRNAVNADHPKSQEGIKTGMIDKKPAWHFEDGRGCKRIGTYEGNSNFGGSDISYHMREAGTGDLHIVSGSHLKNSERLWGETTGGVAKTEDTMVTFAKSFTHLGSFQANIGKSGRGWYHGNQHEAGGTSVRAQKYADLMKASKEAYKGGSTLQAKSAEMEAMEHWKKMADGERSHAMQMLNDSAAEDIGKSRDRGFEFGHGRTAKK